MDTISSFQPYPNNENLHLRSQPRTSTQQNPNTRTTSPIVTGTSVLGITYKDGVMLAADTLASYGSLARFKSVERILPLQDEILIGASGEYSDFQEVMKTLEDLTTQDRIIDDGSVLPPSAVHSYLTRILYQRRNKFDPLYGQFVVAGFHNGESFLGFSDLRGTSYVGDLIATGFGGYLALPLLRNEHRKDMTFEEAKHLLEKCLRVLFYRDARALNKIQIATITKDGPVISSPYPLSTDWNSGEIVYGNLKFVPTSTPR